MQIWRVWHGQDGYEVELAEVPWWTLAASFATEVADGATGHLFCGSRSPDWMWRLPIGRPVYDDSDEPLLVNSLAGALYDYSSRLACLDISRARTLYRFPVSAELAADLGWVRQSWEDEDESDDNAEV